jgi:outer membrane autotransporter protein
VIGADSVPLGLAGVISGPGGVSITAGGSATLSGTNTYTGPTSISGGYLAVVGPGSIAASSGVNVSAGGVFDISGTNDGASIRSLAGDQNGIVWLGSQTLTITTAQDVFAGTIAGSGGLTLAGGVEALTGANTYTGATAVNAATLVVNGSIASSAGVTVNGGGTLSGTGIVATTTINAGGTLAPGNGPIGTLSVAGNLTFQPQSIYQVGVFGGSPTSTAVSGTTTLAGNVQTLFLSGNFNTPYTVLTSSAINGTFNSVTSLQPGVTASATYTGDGVSLTFSSALGQVSGLSANEAAVGSALDRVANATGMLPGGLNTLYLLFSAPQVAAALNQLSGQSLASEQTVLTNQAFYSRDAVLARLRQAGYAGSAGPQAVLSYAGPDTVSLNDPADRGEPLAYAGSTTSAAASASPLKALPAPIAYVPTGITFWAQGMGGWGKINGNSNAAGTTGNFAGVLSGADTRLANNWLVGFALGYTGSSTSVSALASSAQVDTGVFAGYAGTNFGALNLRLGGTYAINSVYTTRQIAFPGFMDRDTARFNAGIGQVFGEVGYGTAISFVAVEPFAELAYVHLDTAGFTENGGPSALSTSGASQDTGYSSLGVRAATAYTLWNGMMLIPRASVAWQNAFGEINPVTGLAFAGIPGSNFNVTGIPIARNAALIDAGADLRINPQAKVGLYYWGQQANTAHENGMRGTVTWVF